MHLSFFPLLLSMGVFCYSNGLKHWFVYPFFLPPQSEMRTKVLEAKYQEEKLKLQQRHDADVQKVFPVFLNFSFIRWSFRPLFGLAILTGKRFSALVLFTLSMLSWLKNTVIIQPVHVWYNVHSVLELALLMTHLTESVRLFVRWLNRVYFSNWLPVKSWMLFIVWTNDEGVNEWVKCNVKCHCGVKCHWRFLLAVSNRVVLYHYLGFIHFNP